MLEGKVLKDFCDKENKLKLYKADGKTVFKAENKRYKELEAKGYVEEGKEIITKASK